MPETSSKERSQILAQDYKVLILAISPEASDLYLLVKSNSLSCGYSSNSFEKHPHKIPSK